MRIQEMRSGLSHLKKRMREEGRENPFDSIASPTFLAETDEGLPLAADCELDDPVWSVVSFAQREAGGMTYSQAAGLMAELDSHGVAGLCIITDAAAARVG